MRNGTGMDIDRRRNQQSCHDVRRHVHIVDERYQSTSGFIGFVTKEVSSAALDLLDFVHLGNRLENMRIRNSCTYEHDDEQHCGPFLLFT